MHIHTHKSEYPNLACIFKVLNEKKSQNKKKIIFDQYFRHLKNHFGSNLTRNIMQGLKGIMTEIFTDNC